MRKEIFEDYSVTKAIASLVVPNVLAMIVTIAYNLADTFFVGQTGDPNQVAAVSLASPAFMIFMSIGNLFGVGGGSFISRLMGMKEYDKAKHVSAFSFYTCLITSAVMSVLFIVFLPQILPVLGTSKDTYQPTYDYLFIMCCGGIMGCMQNSLMQLLRSEGAAKPAMVGMMIGTGFNLILDPIMILWMNMGVAGAAVATIIGMSSQMVFYIIYILKKSTILSLSIKKFSVKNKIPSTVLGIGVSVFISQTLMTVCNVVVNNFLYTYGDDVIAAYGVAMRVFNVLVMILMGIGQGVQPFIGYNYAAKQYSRMNKCIKYTSLLCVIAGVICTVPGEIFAASIISAFINDTIVIGHGENILRALLVFGPTLGIQFVMIAAFQAFGKVKQTLFLSFARQGIIFIPMLIILNSIYGLNGLIWAQPIAEILAVIIAVTMYIVLYNKMKAEAIQLQTEGKTAV